MVTAASPEAMKVAPARLFECARAVDLLTTVDVVVEQDRAAAPSERVLVAQRAPAIEAEAA